MGDSFQELSKEYIDIDDLIKAKEKELSELYDMRDKIRLRLVSLLTPMLNVYLTKRMPAVI